MVTAGDVRKDRACIRAVKRTHQQRGKNISGCSFFIIESF